MGIGKIILNMGISGVPILNIWIKDPDIIKGKLIKMERINDINHVILLV